MKIVHSVGEMINLAYTFRSGGKTLGFVPTMGALHQGHLSLLSIAQKNSDISVMSIFVNPVQFGPNEDYTRYPRPFENDCSLAREAGCDILFAPTAAEMYPPDFRTSVMVNGITQRLCGASRPTHFTGVTTVVLKFLNIIHPQIVVFGAKDAQQVIVLKRMISDLHCPVSIMVGPIIREIDGLALSSRNTYLTSEERTAASAIHRGIVRAESLFSSGMHEAGELVAAAQCELERYPLIRPEYIELVDCISLKPLKQIETSALLAIACRMSQSETRLIDNTIFGGTL